MSDMTIELPNSPGVEVTVTRGGIDPITREPLSDQWTHMSWTEGDDTKTHSFIGPPV